MSRKGKQAVLFINTLYFYTQATHVLTDHTKAVNISCVQQTLDFIGLVCSPVVITTSHLKTDN
jgi:hypothetical protein